MRIILALCATTALFGCAITPQEPPTQHSWLQRSAQLNKLNHWRAQGKIAIRTAQQSESGSLVWQQKRHNTHISLSGPLGLGATIIESDGRGLIVSRQGSTQHYDISSDQKTVASTGWDLPLSSLIHWIKGLPSPHAEVQSQLIDKGLCRQLVQGGWTITFERYAQFQHYTLPTRINIERDDTRARLILHDWSELRSR